jgi:hypothetical protein
MLGAHAASTGWEGLVVVFAFVVLLFAVCFVRLKR